MRTKTLKNKDTIYDLYLTKDRITFCPVNDELSCVGYDTTCKEEIGQQCVQNKHSRFIVITTHKLKDEHIEKILSCVNSKEKEAKVRATKIFRVKDKDNWLLIEHSPRWSRNSVAHSILTTWLRHAITSHTDSMYFAGDDDESHLSACFWLLDIVKKKGLRVFGTVQHSSYDLGMVSFMHRVQNGCDNPMPNRDDYDNESDWYDDYEIWEDDELGLDYTEEINGSIPSGNHAYKTLIKMYGKK